MYYFSINQSIDTKNEYNLLFRLPTDILIKILSFIYKIPINGITNNKYQCKMCDKILLKTNRSKHMKVHDRKLHIK